MIMWYDVLVLGILVFFALRGAMRGFIFQIASLAGIVLCFVFAGAISNAAGPYVHLDPPLNHWVVLFATYLGFTFVCFLIARMLNEALEKAKLKDFDRHLGVVFGLVKGVVLVLILTFFIVTVSQSARASLKNSYTGRYCALIMDRLAPVMPPKLHLALEDYIHLLDSPDLDLKHSHDPFPENPAGNSGADFTLGLPSTIPATAAPGSRPVPEPVPTPAKPSLWTQLENLFNNQSQQVVSDALQKADPQTRAQLEQTLQAVVTSIPQQDRAALQQQIVQVGAGQLQQYLDWRLSQLGRPVSSPPSTQPAAPAPVPTPTPVPIPAGVTSNPGGISNGFPPTTNPPNKPTPAPQPATPLPTTGTDPQTILIQEIAGVYSTLPNIRQNIEQDIRRRIAGVPEAVTRAALLDWKADLFGTRPDPDPQTAQETTVEIRILHQLQFQGIRIDQLSADAQQRLRAAQAQTSSFGNPL